jgi:alpha-beta hydrolase superfamily lysophospholipase
MKHIEDGFRGQGGLNLYYQCWLPAGEPLAVLVLVHGLAEHSGRYGNVVDYFVPRGYAVCSLDHRGHGKSQGLPGYVERFSHYVSDLIAFLDIARHLFPRARIIAVGHSVGGTIATAGATRAQENLDGLILSGAFVKPGASLSPAKIMAAQLLSMLLPKMGVDTIDATAISQDEAVVQAYLNDPMVYHGKVSARLGAEIITAMWRLPGEIAVLRLPVLIMHGSEDRLSRPEGSRLLYERFGSKHKTLKLYRGYHHELFNEPGRRQVFEDMEHWLGVDKLSEQG